MVYAVRGPASATTVVKCLIEYAYSKSGAAFQSGRFRRLYCRLGHALLSALRVRSALHSSSCSALSCIALRCPACLALSSMSCIVLHCPALFCMSCIALHCHCSAFCSACFALFCTSFGQRYVSSLSPIVSCQRGKDKTPLFIFILLYGKKQKNWFWIRWFCWK